MDHGTYEMALEIMLKLKNIPLDQTVQLAINDVERTLSHLLNGKVNIDISEDGGCDIKLPENETAAEFLEIYRLHKIL